jgi:hypothetical protein
VTIPLSFATGIIISLLTTERTAVAGFAALERRMHLGAAADRVAARP